MKIIKVLAVAVFLLAVINVMLLYKTTYQQTFIEQQNKTLDSSVKLYSESVKHLEYCKQYHPITDVDSIDVIIEIIPEHGKLLLTE